MTKNNDINNAAFIYSVNMLRVLLKLDLITEEEFEKTVEINAAHYGVEGIYV